MRPSLSLKYDQLALLFTPFVLTYRLRIQTLNTLGFLREV